MSKLVHFLMTLGGVHAGAATPLHPPFAPRSPDEWVSMNATRWISQLLPAEALESAQLTDDPQVHALFYAISHMNQVLSADEGEIKDEATSATPSRRRLTSVSDTYCSDKNINADQAPSTAAGTVFAHATNPSKPCTDGKADNCPQGPGLGNHYKGSVFKLGDDKLVVEGVEMQFYVAWGFSHGPDSDIYSSLTNWHYWMATCFQAKYTNGLKVNEAKENLALLGTNDAVACNGCFVDYGATATIGFNYVYNSYGDSEESDSDDYEEDYELKTSLNGDLDYKLDFKVEDPSFDLADWQGTSLPEMSLYSKQVNDDVKVEVQGTGSVWIMGKAAATGSFTATGSLDTNVNVGAGLEKGEAFTTSAAGGVSYTPAAVDTSDNFEYSSLDMDVSMDVEFPMKITATIGNYGVTGHELSLEAAVTASIIFEILLSFDEGDCDPEKYQVTPKIKFEAGAMGTTFAPAQQTTLPAIIQYECADATPVAAPTTPDPVPVAAPTTPDPVISSDGALQVALAPVLGLLSLLFLI